MKKRREYLKKVKQSILSVITTPKNKTCAAGQLCFLELGWFFRSHTTWYFSKLLDLQPEPKLKAQSSHGCDICQDHFAHVLHHLAVHPRTHLQPKQTTESATSQRSEKSIF